MKATVLLILLLNFSVNGISQKKMPVQYIGVGLNSVSNIKLYSTFLNDNSIKKLLLNFIVFGYGIEYIPNQLGFSPEKLSKIAVNFTYKIFTKRTIN